MDFTSLKGQTGIAYARFSSDNQKESSIDDQVRRCRDEVARRGGDADALVVIPDKAVSGASLDRDGMRLLLQMVQKQEPKITFVITEDLSRISRDVADAQTFRKKLEFYGVKFLAIADGIDTSQQHSKLSYLTKSFVAEFYLDDLRDKTLRGMKGRALKGFSTGNLPYGFKSELSNPSDAESAKRIVVVEEEANLIVRIFTLYLEGFSLDGIATLFNDERIPSPRTRKKRSSPTSWRSSCIREMLRNQKYNATWKFGEKKYIKVPETNKRVARPQDESEIITVTREELRIVGPELWTKVQERLEKIRSIYTQTPEGAPKVISTTGRVHKYLLSGILRCGNCNGPLVIVGGSSKKYYGCGDAKKCGDCHNKLIVREDIAREQILAELRSTIMAPGAVDYARKRIAERLGDAHRQLSKRKLEYRQRLRRTEQRIQNLIQRMADGIESEYVAKALKDLESQAASDRAALESFEQSQSVPTHLPSPDQVLQGILNLQCVLDSNPAAAREAFARLFKAPGIVCHAQSNRTYVATAEALPLALVLSPKHLTPAASGTNVFDNSRSGPPQPRPVK